MKTIKFILALSVLFISNVNAQKTWNVDQSHSSVQFNVTHLLISEVDGKFKKFEGSIISSKEDFSDAKFNFKVQISSVDTGNKQRDTHLQAADFFDAKKHPKMSFTSSSFKKVSDKQYTLKGNLTIHGISKEISFNVKHGGIAKDGWGNTKAGFKATTTINRKDFGINGGGVAVGDEINIKINLEVTLAK